MRLAAENTATLKLEIPDRTLASSLLEAWSGRPGVSLNILRARVTSDDVRFELKLSGAPAAVARIVRQSASWDAGRKFLHPVPTAAPA
jgi:hypothetical protein